ncbi:MAG: MltA domain-containing protein [Acetobacteraceae bacterium]|nr:MltA domain-containing protein [Acetobacteraceae bacterium]
MPVVPWRLPALLLVAGLATLAGCAPHPTAGNPPAAVVVPAGPGPARTPVRFDQVPGWATDRISEAVPAFLAGCARLDPAADAKLPGLCTEARTLPPGDDAAARAFFERSFRPYLASTDGSAKGLVTGYYEPEFRAARRRGGIYQTPLLRRPPGQVQGRVLPSRAQIERGALARRGLEMLWVADPVDAFFLHIQGSGRARLPNGEVIRLTYDGQNGQTYVPIGRVLVDRGEMALEDVSMQSIRAWLVAHPREAKGVMDQNPSYIFFREVRDAAPDAGPPGAMGVPLTPLRSVAVDRVHIPLGTPVWLDTNDALTPTTPFRRLMMAQDVGGAIRGPLRADIFFGWGPDAEARAGKMRQPGSVYVLLPR